MNNSNDQQTRESRHKRQKEDRLLNVLIAAVVLAILIVGSVVISSNPKSPEKAAKKGQDEEVTEPKEVDEPNPTPDEQEADTEQIVSDEEDIETNETEETEDGREETRVITDVSDGIVSQSIVDEAWEPIPTAQQGAHSSSYNRDSVDWQEKVEAISSATGLSEDGMILWKLKNGGSPQKSIGIISSKDQSEKYRVYLEWVDNEGWKPVKMDVLNTLNFDY